MLYEVITTNALKKESYTVTVLDEKGKEAAHFLCMCDQFSSLNKFSGEVYDRTGNLIRKIKKSELKMSEYSSGLTTDDYMYFFECNIGQYPYTVKYEWEIKYKNGFVITSYSIHYTKLYEEVWCISTACCW